MADPNLTAKLSKYKEGAVKYQERRHLHWNENYQLYRDKVIVNRLTQRQSVNVPLVKETIKTALARVDDLPEIEFESLSGDKQKEIYINEYWKAWSKKAKLEIKDIVDKKQEMLYGRTFMKLNIVNGEVTLEVLEPQDIKIDRFADPTDIDGTANYLLHTNIYRTLNQVELNDSYDKGVIKEIKTQYASAMGLNKSEETYEEKMAKEERMINLGDTETEDPALGEVWVELEEHYIRLKKDNEVNWYVITTLDDRILREAKMKDLMGVDELVIVSWAGDVERTDIWSDGVADIVRTPNKILNSWFSQLVENRNLRNYGMNYYDSTKGEGKWLPQTYSPEPWAWIPTAGDPNKTVKRVDIPNLSDSMEEMSFVISMIERSTATTSSIKGDTEDSVTLGEVEIATANANERISSMSKFYVPARKQLAEKWYRIVENNNIKPLKLHKKSAKGNYFEQEVDPAEFKDEAGFECKAIVKADQEKEKFQQVERLNAVSMKYQQNVPLQKITKEKMLDLIDLTPEEKQEVMEFDEAMIAQGANPMGTPDPENQPPIPSPEQFINNQQ